MTEVPAAPRFIGCETGDGNTADITMVVLYSGDAHIVCWLHCFELVNAAAQAFAAPDSPEIAQAVEFAGDMTQAEVIGSYSAGRGKSLTEREDPDEFEFDGTNMTDAEYYSDGTPYDEH